MERVHIELRDVTKAYDDHVALDGVSAGIERGEFVFVVGPSGSGKSTLLRLLSRELIAEWGEVCIDGEDLADLPARRLPELRRRVAVVPQDHHLLRSRTVEENVVFGLSVLGWHRRAAQKRAAEVLELVGLGQLSSRMPQMLSGGERQRVAIARAIAPGPEILLADEPTGNLDPQTTASIAVLLDEVARGGCTVVMATHDVRVVDAMRRRVLALHAGELVRDGGGTYAGVVK